MLLDTEMICIISRTTNSNVFAGSRSVSILRTEARHGAANVPKARFQCPKAEEQELGEFVAVDARALNPWSGDQWQMGRIQRTGSRWLDNNEPD
jgi:hypothetical protein